MTTTSIDVLILISLSKISKRKSTRTQGSPYRLAGLRQALAGKNRRTQCRRSEQEQVRWTIEAVVGARSSLWYSRLAVVTMGKRAFFSNLTR